MRLGGFIKGVDNVHHDTEIAADALRRAVNVDVLDSGNIKRRKGHALVTALNNAHSLWSDNEGNGYLLQNNNLQRVLTNGAVQTVGAVQSGANHLSYVRVNADIYFSCKTAKGRIKNNVIEPWGIETPATPPVVSVTTGTLNAGVYHAVVTYLLADGRESGASVQSKITLADVGGIAVTGLPIPVNAAVTKKRLYLSEANSELLYFVKELNPADQFATINSHIDGAELRHQHMIEPPLSTCLMEANGRIFMVDASDPRIVWYTNALDYDHVNSAKNYYQFPADVTQIASTRTGLYVASDKTYYIANAGSDEATQTEVFDYGAIANTAQLIPASHEYIWMTERGAVIGHDGGQAELLSASTCVTGKMTDAASMVRENDGLRQYVVVGNKAGKSSLEAQTYFDAEVVRQSA